MTRKAGSDNQDPNFMIGCVLTHKECAERSPYMEFPASSVKSIGRSSTATCPDQLSPQGAQGKATGSIYMVCMRAHHGMRNKHGEPISDVIFSTRVRGF